MKPGRELDALVAEHVMGWTHIASEVVHFSGRDLYGHPPNREFILVPHFSTSIADAWKVVERLNEMGFNVELHLNASDIDTHCEVAVRRRVDTNRVIACPVPYAICLAALKAVGYEPQ